MSVVFSFLCSLVLLLALLKNVVHATYSFRPPGSTCVWTERQLRKVIERASNKNRTVITLCRQLISISNKRNQYNLTGIDLTDRIISLRCYLKRSDGTCTLSGKEYSRIFYGEKADLTVRNVMFTNGKADDCTKGGAINVYESNVKLAGCSFINNVAYDTSNECESGGGAIYASESTLMIKGGSKNMPVLFSGNEGAVGGALYAFKSKVFINGYTVFSNSSTLERGAVFLYLSTLSITNVKFQQNFGADGSALRSYISQTTMKNVEFIENYSSDSAIGIFYSSLTATNCTFSNHNVTVLRVFESKITLKNSTFSNNTSNEDGSNIYILDDYDPLPDGTFVTCESNVLFCNGLDESSIYELSSDNTIDMFNNTNCNTKGVQGKPGQGSCPI